MVLYWQHVLRLGRGLLLGGREVGDLLLGRMEINVGVCGNLSALCVFLGLHYRARVQGLLPSTLLWEVEKEVFEECLMSMVPWPLLPGSGSTGYRFLG